MYLIGLQYQNSSAVERLVLKTLPVFKQAIEYPVIVKILEGVADEDTIFGVLMSNTLVRRIEPNFYELLPQAKEAIFKQPDRDDETLTRRELHRRAAEFYNSIRLPVKDCYTGEQFAPFFNAFDHFYSAGLFADAADLFYEDFLKICALGYLNELIDRCELLKGKLVEKKLEADNSINLGLALDSLGRLNEAVDEYDKAIAIIKPLVEAGREELANDLAKTYLNKGSALYLSDKLVEAAEEYEKAIIIQENLFTLQKREELANDLAKSYWGKAIVLAGLEKLIEANEVCDDAIEIWDKCLQRDEIQILPNLFAVLDLKTDVLIKAEQLKQTAENLNQTFRFREKALKEYEISQHFKDKIESEWNDIIKLVRNLSPEKREEIYKHAGETGDAIRQFVEDVRDE